MIKLMKKVNRLLGLEVKGPRGGPHKTSKKDVDSRMKNTIKVKDLEE